MNFILSSRGSNDETYVEVISLLAQYMQCSKCSVNVCGMNKFKRRKEEKRRQRFTPCHLSMQMPHPSHQHTHIQHGLLKGLIHYVVNSLPSVTLSASSSQYQSSLMPRQQLPPTRQPGVAQMVREHKARGTRRRREYVDDNILESMMAENFPILGKETDYVVENPQSETGPTQRGH